MKRLIYSLIAVMLMTLAANAGTKTVVWDEATINNINVGRSYMNSSSQLNEFLSINGITMSMYPASGANMSFYNNHLEANCKLYFQNTEGLNFTRIVIKATQASDLLEWTNDSTRIVWTGVSPIVPLGGTSRLFTINGIRSISFYLESSDSIPDPPVTSVDINETNFPDANFRSWLTNQSYGYDRVLTLEEIADVKQISITDKYVQSLKGIEYFTALTTLFCYRNNLTTLDLSKNTALTNLSCSDNKLTSIDLSKNTALTSLNVAYNQLTSLDLSKNTALTNLSCTKNQLSMLDFSACKNITSISCDQNRIKGAAMDTLVQSLPTVSSGTLNVLYGYSGEANVMTTKQVAAAKAKGWTPKWLDPSYGWTDYAGSQPPVVTYSITDIPGSWQVNGRVVSDSISSGVTGTILIPEGERVIFKPQNIPAGKKIKSIKVVKQ